ncbi:MAG: hypothetical protein AB7K68_00195 [Bacteriovoracia bacterium]
MQPVRTNIKSLLASKKDIAGLVYFVFLSEDRLASSEEIPFAVQVIDDPSIVRFQIFKNGIKVYSESVIYRILRTAIKNLPERAFTNNGPARRETMLANLDLAKQNLDKNQWDVAYKQLNELKKYIRNNTVQTSKIEPLEYEQEQVLSEFNLGEIKAVLAGILLNQRKKLFGLSANKQNFSVGERVNLSARVLSSLTNPEQEYFLESYFDGSPLKIEAVSSGIYGAKSIPLSLGSHIWEVRAYVQNSRWAKSIEQGIVASEGEVLANNKRLERETDPQEIGIITDRNIMLLNRIQDLKIQLNAGRTLVSVEAINQIFVN